MNLLRRFVEEEKLQEWVAAEKASIRLHARATTWNAGSLGVGIFLVFLGGLIGGVLVTPLMYVGISSVLVGVVGYLICEWVAMYYDEALAALATPVRVEGPVAAALVVDPKEISLVVPKPRWLVLDQDQVRIVYEEDKVAPPATPPPAPRSRPW